MVPISVEDALLTELGKEAAYVEEATAETLRSVELGPKVEESPVPVDELPAVI